MAGIVADRRILRKESFRYCSLTVPALAESGPEPPAIPFKALTWFGWNRIGTGQIYRTITDAPEKPPEHCYSASPGDLLFPRLRLTAARSFSSWRSLARRKSWRDCSFHEGSFKGQSAKT
jgi:hypothetical protein